MFNELASRKSQLKKAVTVVTDRDGHRFTEEVAADGKSVLLPRGDITTPLPAWLRGSSSSGSCANELRVWKFNVDSWIELDKPKERMDSKRADAMKICTFNVWFAEENQRERAKIMFEILAATQADVIGLQEVTPLFLNLLCQEDWVRESYTVSDSPKKCLTVCPYGVVLLVRSEWIDSFHIQALPSGMGRSLVYADLTVNDSKWRVASVHLESLGNSAVRCQQLQTINETMEPCDNAILMGDFNFGHDAMENTRLPRGFLDSWPSIGKAEADGKTNCGQRIDRIMFKSSTFSLSEMTLMGCAEPRPSDHLGLQLSIAAAASTQRQPPLPPPPPLAAPKKPLPPPPPPSKPTAAAAPPPPPPKAPTAADLSKRRDQVKANDDKAGNNPYAVPERKNWKTTDIDAWSWKDATWCISAGGSGGTFIAGCKQHNNNGCVMLKASSTIIQDEGALRIARLLGIAVPNTRIVQYCGKSKEWYEIKKWAAIVEAKDEVTGRKLIGAMNRAFVTVMGFEENCVPLSEMRMQTAQQMMGAEAFHIIGRTLVLDMITNNWDRIPLLPLWQLGNEGNLLVNIHHPNRIVPIDPAITCLKSQPSAAYLQKVDGVARDLISGAQRGTASDTANSVIQYFSLVTGHQFPAWAALALQRGFFDGVVAASLISEEQICKLVTTLKNECAGDWEDVWASGAAALDASFFFSVMTVLTTALPPQDSREIPRPSEFIKVLAIQTKTMSKLEMNACLDQQMQVHQHRKPDFVLFCEGFVNEYGSADTSNLQVAAACKKALEHNIYIVLGTLEESNGILPPFITSVVISPQGEVITAYRKQHVCGTAHLSQGQDPGIFQTEWGCIAVMICSDMENQPVFDRTLALNPILLLAPIHIPVSGPMARDQGQHQRAWVPAMDTWARKLEWMCRERGMSFVRCDSCYPRGMGTSVAITPNATLYSPSPLAAALTAYVPSNPKQNIFTGNCGYRARTERIDNTGNRYVVATTATGCTDTLLSVHKSSSSILVRHRGGSLIRYSLDLSSNGKVEANPDEIVLALCSDHPLCLVQSRDVDGFLLRRTDTSQVVSSYPNANLQVLSPNGLGFACRENEKLSLVTIGKDGVAKNMSIEDTSVALMDTDGDNTCLATQAPELLYFHENNVFRATMTEKIVCVKACDRYAVAMTDSGNVTLLSASSNLSFSLPSLPSTPITSAAVLHLDANKIILALSSSANQNHDCNFLYIYTVKLMIDDASNLPQNQIVLKIPVDRPIIAMAADNYGIVAVLDNNMVHSIQFTSQRHPFAIGDMFLF